MKYPRLTTFVVIIAICIYFFSLDSVQAYLHSLGSFGYLGIFIAGALYARIFGAPIGTGLLVSIPHESILVATLIGTLGAFTSDLIIIEIFEKKLVKEFDRLRKIKLIKDTEAEMRKRFSKTSIKITGIATAIIFLITPLPNEIGIALFEENYPLHPHILELISFFSNFAGIALILLISI